MHTSLSDTVTGTVAGIGGAPGAATNGGLGAPLRSLIGKE